MGPIDIIAEFKTHGLTLPNPLPLATHEAGGLAKLQSLEQISSMNDIDARTALLILLKEMGSNPMARSAFTRLAPHL